jgi:hypothetical protein
MMQYYFIGRLKDLPSLHALAFHLHRVPGSMGTRSILQYHQVSLNLEFIWM